MGWGGAKGFVESLLSDNEKGVEEGGFAKW